MTKRIRLPAAMLWAVVAAAVAPVARGQIIRVPQRASEQRGWVSASGGFLAVQRVSDGSTLSDWFFGNATQYRVSVEMPLQSGSTLGIVAATARVPLEYRPFATNTATACSVGCDADANISQLLAALHIGRSGMGVYQVIDLAAGATIYWNFRERGTGAALEPSSPDLDLALSLGYGFGYAFSPDMQVELVQDGAFSMHQRTGLSAGDNTLIRQFTTRIGMRFGLGAR